MTLLDICLAVHTHNTGASDPIPEGRLSELVQILRDATLFWGEGHVESALFDMAVRNLVDHTIAENNRYERKKRA